MSGRTQDPLVSRFLVRRLVWFGGSLDYAPYLAGSPPPYFGVLSINISLP